MSNRAELDAFFAKAEDVLTEWAGSADAAHAKDGEYYEWGTDFAALLPLVAASEAARESFRASMLRVSREADEVATNIDQFRLAWMREIRIAAIVARAVSAPTSLAVISGT